ncbi:hypothetical protein [Paraliomyxa miuraensis]|uniref:hypothetical protein n=1 Tax=Paraliomyxa miuraensis TaxID=376150 RepID=UPI00225749EC|nr:hypothetical protein [Paraliomyxa miuraensis]MCX4242033.1 hypothetical protein [Paraliomyxa miuraensis]
MGLFDSIRGWLQRRRMARAGFHLVAMPDGSQALVDSAMKAYLEGSGPDPTQTSLDEALAGSIRVQVFDGGSNDGRPMRDEILYETDDRVAIDALVSTLRIVEDPETFGHCMCHGDPTLQFVDAQGGTCVIGLHHGHGIRWNGWHHDAQLVNGTKLADWLADHGVPGMREAMKQAKDRETAALEAMAGWDRAMPDGVREVWEEHKHRILAEGIIVDIEPFATALVRELAEPDERIRALLRWFGSGQGPWSGFPSYETLPEQLLLESPTTAVVGALDERDLADDSALAEGAARFLGGWEFRSKRPDDIGLIDPRLARVLLDHVERRTDDEDRLKRARAAFG